MIVAGPVRSSRHGETLRVVLLTGPATTSGGR